MEAGYVAYVGFFEKIIGIIPEPFQFPVLIAVGFFGVRYFIKNEMNGVRREDYYQSRNDDYHRNSKEDREMINSLRADLKALGDDLQKAQNEVIRLQNKLFEVESSYSKQVNDLQWKLDRADIEIKSLQKADELLTGRRYDNGE